jgi:hypothetical protein
MWVCPTCTYRKNVDNALTCNICLEPRPELPPPVVDIQEQINDEPSPVLADLDLPSRKRVRVSDDEEDDENEESDEALPEKKTRVAGADYTCHVCKQTKSAKAFPKEGYVCTTCKNQRGKARRTLKKERFALKLTKACIKCHETKPEAEFRMKPAEMPGDRKVAFFDVCLHCESLGPKARKPKAKGPLNPPPDDWHPEDSPDKRTADWAALGCPGRDKVRNGVERQAEMSADRRARVTAVALAAVAAGTALQRQKTYLERGGVRRYATEAERAAAEKASYAAKSKRRSIDILQYRLEHCSKCMDAECTIDWRVKQADGTLVDAEPIVSVFEFDHEDDRLKLAPVTTLVREQRDAERIKTTPRCLACHQKHTQKQIGQRDTWFVMGTERALRIHKLAVGCQYPHHSTMPYAQAIAAWGGSYDRSYPMYEVAHTVLGMKTRASPSNGEKLAHIADGKACIMCLFCHQLWTVCERHHLSPHAPLTKHDYDALYKYYPEFIAHFDEMTAGFDWEAEAARRNRTKSLAQQRRHAAKKLAAASNANVKGGEISEEESAGEDEDGVEDDYDEYKAD